MEPLLHYKAEIVRRGKKLKDLQQAIEKRGHEMSYQTLGQVLNGFVRPPLYFDRLMREILNSWDQILAEAAV